MLDARDCFAPLLNLHDRQPRPVPIPVRVEDDHEYELIQDPMTTDQTRLVVLVF